MSNENIRVNNVQVLGVDESFYKFSQGKTPFNKDSIDTIALNKPLAQRLKAKVGDDIVLRIEKPSLMPRDVPLTPVSDLAIAFRLKVISIAGEEDFGTIQFAGEPG